MFNHKKHHPIFDIYIISNIGGIIYFFSALFLGVGVVAIPTGIISAGFVERYTQFQTNKAERKVKGTVSVKLDSSSSLVRRTVKEIERKYDLSVIVVVRSGNVLLSTDKLRLKAGDTVVYQTDEIER